MEVVCDTLNVGASAKIDGSVKADTLSIDLGLSYGVNRPSKIKTFLCTERQICRCNGEECQILPKRDWSWSYASSSK